MTNEEKQIEEMAKMLYDCFGTMSLTETDSKAISRYLYSKDYRKVERGEWIPRHYTRHCSCGKSERVMHYECSACKRIAYNQPYGLSFCPNCGADMRKGGEE